MTGPTLLFSDIPLLDPIGQPVSLQHQFEELLLLILLRHLA
jgi:hypothetical protein